MRPIPLLAFSLLCLLVLSASTCSSPLSPAKGGDISIVAYNVKSLFDAIDAGTEFAEFSVAKGKWDDARYKLRLQRVGEAVLAALPEDSRPRGSLPGPDILCLEEIENQAVLEALRAGPLAKARYRYAAIAPAEGGPFSVCALSRLPILRQSCHAAFGSKLSRSGRDILELELDSGSGKLLVFACHWKSKSEGAQATEAERRGEAALLRGLMAERLAADPDLAVLACGDFNESPDEYLRAGRRYATALMPVEEAALAEAANAAPVPAATGSLAAPGARLLVSSNAAGARPFGASAELVLYSPWAESGGYSYSYRGSRERLDGFLLGPGLLGGGSLRYKRFSAVEASFLVDDSGAPAAWPGSGASGYSDHLPVLLVLQAAKAEP